MLNGISQWNPKVNLTNIRYIKCNTLKERQYLNEPVYCEIIQFEGALAM